MNKDPTVPDNGKKPAAKRKAKPVDLSAIPFKKKNMLDTVLSLPWNSYTARTSALAVPLIEQVALDAIRSSKPESFVLGDAEDESGEIPLAPSIEKSKANLDVNWTKAGRRASIDLHKLLTVRHIPMPRGTTAHIPISRDEVEGLGHSIILHCNEITYEEIEEGKRKAQKAKKAAAANSAEQPAPNKPASDQPAPDKPAAADSGPAAQTKA